MARLLPRDIALPGWFSKIINCIVEWRAPGLDARLCVRGMNPGVNTRVGEANDKRPLIGVSTSRTRGRFSYTANALALRLAGARSKRLGADQSPEVVDQLDGLLIGGGDDISARVYQGDFTLDVRIDEERDRFELEALERAIPRGLPVLGVCRGAQLINVFFGGTLHHDLDEKLWRTNRRTVMPRLRIELVPGTRLAQFMKHPRIFVNAIHHQAVDKLADNLVAAAYDEEHIIQGVEDRERDFVIGVQWHPELLIYHSHQRALFRALVDATRSARTPSPEPSESSPAAAR